MGGYELYTFVYDIWKILIIVESLHNENYTVDIIASFLYDQRFFRRLFETFIKFANNQITILEIGIFMKRKWIERFVLKRAPVYRWVSKFFTFRKLQIKNWFVDTVNS